MTRAAIYVRKSTSAGLEQEFNSLDAQYEACASYARSRGWTVLTDRYEDGGYTGANIDRPAFQRLLADIEGGRLDVVVVYKVDRLSRSLLDFAKVMDRFHAAGVAFVSVTQNFSTADAMGRLTLNMLMSFAEFEREMIAERTRDKIAAARRRGKWTGGIAPHGYRIEASKLVIVDSEARVVRAVFALYLEHRSLLAVIRELSERGWNRRGGAWTKDSLLRVLRNPVYIGKIRHGAELHAGEHEPIVADDVFAKAKAVLEREPASSPKRNPEYVLRGILRCGACGHAMTTASTRKAGRTYRFYRCVTRDKAGAAACPTGPLAAEPIERAVLDRLRRRAPEVDVSAVERAIQERLAADHAALAVVLKEEPSRIAGLSREMTELFERLPSLRPAARALAEERLEELDVARKDHEARLVEWQERSRTLDSEAVDARWITTALADVEALWEGMTPENRGRLIAALVARVVLHDRHGELEIVMADEAEVAA